MACSSSGMASGLASTGIVLAAKRMKNGGGSKLLGFCKKISVFV